MRRGGQHGVRPVLGALEIAGVELIRSDAELPRRAAYFIDRNETVIDIERGIFQALGHYRPGELLEFQSEIKFSAVKPRLVF